METALLADSELNTSFDILETLIKPDGVHIQWRDQILNAAIGGNGVIAAEDKIEGDLKTPKGCYRVTHGFYRPDRMDCPKSIIPFAALQPSFGWCDEPSHSFYNQHILKPFDASHEDLWRDDDIYDLILVTDHNTNPIVPGKGGAVFIHVAHDDFAPTAGCLALRKEDLLMIVESCESGLVWVI
jgi:L,D-peptidoglycan transpeptidase YkuD (ErfK/YbiS/YcfS/YnhG family)